jgi:hypothetical protein
VLQRQNFKDKASKTKLQRQNFKGKTSKTRSKAQKKRLWAFFKLAHYRKSPTLAKTARMGHPTPNQLQRPNFKNHRDKTKKGKRDKQFLFIPFVTLRWSR